MRVLVFTVLISFSVIQFFVPGHGKGEESCDNCKDVPLKAVVNSSNNKLFLLTEGGLLVINPENGNIENTKTILNPTDIVFSEKDNKIFISTTSKIELIDASNLNTVKEFRITHSRLPLIIVDKKNENLLQVDPHSKKITIFNLKSYNKRKIIKLKGLPTAFAINSNNKLYISTIKKKALIKTYVSNTPSSKPFPQIEIFNLNNFKNEGSIEVIGNQVIDIVTDTQHEKLYLIVTTNRINLSTNIATVDWLTQKVTSSFPVYEVDSSLRETSGITIDENLNKLYISVTTALNKNTLIEFDTIENKITNIAKEDTDTGKLLAIDPDKKIIYTISGDPFNGFSLNIINKDTLERISTTKIN